MGRTDGAAAPSDHWWHLPGGHEEPTGGQETSWMSSSLLGCEQLPLVPSRGNSMDLGAPKKGGMNAGLVLMWKGDPIVKNGVV